MRTDLVLDALRMALGTRGPGADVDLVHHSDRGSQYTSIDFTQELTDHGVLASVGSVGDANDNAMAESFVDSFKTELVAERVFRSRSQLELAVVEWIAWFNDDRLHESRSRLKCRLRSSASVFPTMSPSQDRISASHQRNASPALPSLHRTIAPEREPYRSPPARL